MQGAAAADINMEIIWLSGSTGCNRGEIGRRGRKKKLGQHRGDEELVWRQHWFCPFLFHVIEIVRIFCSVFPVFPWNTLGVVGGWNQQCFPVEWATPFHIEPARDMGPACCIYMQVARNLLTNHQALANSSARPAAFCWWKSWRDLC